MLTTVQLKGTQEYSSYQATDYVGEKQMMSATRERKAEREKPCVRMFTTLG